LWLARSSWRTHTFQKPSMDVAFKIPHGQPQPGVYGDGGSLSTQLPVRMQSTSVATMAGGFTPGTEQRTRGGAASGQMPRPPIPNRRFTDFTPEQRVQFARQGHGPGG
jgi:hypothetical protein